MILKMSRVQIIGARAHLDPTIAALHRLGVLQVEDAPKSRTLKPLAVDESRSRMQEELTFLGARLEALLQVLPEVNGLPAESSLEPPARAEGLAERARTQLDQIAPAIQDLTKRRDELQAESASLPRYESTLKKLTPLAVELGDLRGFDTAAILIDKPFQGVLDLIRDELERITGGQCEIVAQDVDERSTAALLVYPRSFAQEVQGLLGRENITQVRLPKEIAARSFREALTALSRRQLEVRSELVSVENRLKEIAGKWRRRLEKCRRQVRNRLQELAIATQFGATTHTFVIEGWVPKGKLRLVRETLKQEVGEEVLISELPVTRAERDRAPVAFVNPAPLRPFELLVRVIGVPRYGRIDPTPILAVFLPLFFGIIVGDVAHGSLLLVLALYVRHRFAARETIRDLAQILAYSAVWAIVFGFLYGEFLGSLGAHIGLRPLWMPREGEKILALFAFTLGLGVIQVVLGLLLGAWEAWRERRRSEVVAKASMLLALSAIFGMIGVATRFLPSEFFTPTIVALLIALVLLIVPAGPIGILLGPLEVLETIGNILSYLRLTAIGLASVYLALVANQMAGLVGNVLVGMILAFLLHVLNFALGILSPAIQSLRLHYVEFFRQFYRGEGNEYRPFKTG